MCSSTPVNTNETTTFFRRRKDKKNNSIPDQYQEKTLPHLKGGSFRARFFATRHPTPLRTLFGFARVQGQGARRWEAQDLLMKSRDAANRTYTASKRLLRLGQSRANLVAIQKEPQNLSAVASAGMYFGYVHISDISWPRPCRGRMRREQGWASATAVADVAS